MTLLSAQIREVVVFPDRARVTRQGSLTVNPGLHQIEFADLPLAIQVDSLRVTGRGTASATLLGVEARRTFYSAAPAEAIRQLEQQIEDLQQQDRSLLDRQAAAEVRLGFARNLAEKAAEQLARGLAFGRTDTGQSASVIDFVQQQMEQAQASQRDIERQRRELARQIEKLTNDLNQHRAEQPRERLTAVVEIDVKSSGELTLDLTCLVLNASWTALYDLRLSEANLTSLPLTYLGQVTQRTGEDWDDVALTLSTARPALSTVQPELAPWYLNAYTPPVPAAAPPSLARAAAFGKATTEDLPSQGVLAPQALEWQEAQVASEGASVTFLLAQKVSVPGDGSPHKTVITTLELTPQFDYLSVPKLAEAVYRRAKLVNDSDFLLLAGPVSLFVEGNFTGTLPLKRIAPHEEFDVTLGVDDRVTVKRELKARDVDKKLIGDRRRLRVAYEIEVRNWRANAIALELRDQFPLTRHEQIKVKLEACEPRPAEQTELNELRWQMTVEPQVKHLVRFEFSIEHPAGLTVTGLP